MNRLNCEMCCDVRLSDWLFRMLTLLPITCTGRSVMYTKEELELHRRFGGGATLDGLQCESRSRSLVEHTHIPMVQLSRVIVSHVAPSADHRDRGKMPRKAAYLDSHSIFF